MLKYRVITALCLAPLAMAAVYWLPLDWFALFIAVVAGIAAHEWSTFVGLKEPWRSVYVAVFLLLVLVVYLHFEHAEAILWCSVVLWLIAIAVVVTYPLSERAISTPVVSALVGLVLLSGAWTAMVVLRALPQGADWILWLLLLVWGADIGAYFAGRRFGKHKLAPKVSPGKTWEGVLGGMLLAGSVCAVGLMLLDRTDGEWFGLIGLLITVSVFGDLFESVMKRSSGVKDSGSLLPGHGGVLDRIDSLIAVLPVFCLALIYL